MKTLVTILLLIGSNALGQEPKTITYRTKQDFPQDTYVRIIKTADSLYSEYQDERFQFEKADGSCCDKGLSVILSFYKKALTEKPRDEDALSKVKEVENLMEDEYLYFEEKNYGKVLQKADQYMREDSYQQALGLYYRALELNQNSKPIKKKIKNAKKLLKKSPNT